MINLNEVFETNKMIHEMNLDVRTITIGISLLDCVGTTLEEVKENIYNAASFGVPQERFRSIVIGMKKNFLLPADGVHDFELEAGCLQPGMTDKGRDPIR